VLALSACVFSAAAQPTTTKNRPADEDAWRVLAASDEGTLWVARTTEDKAALFSRRAGAAFDRGRGADRTLSSIRVIAGDAWAAFADGALYQFSPGDTAALPLRNLPQRIRPIDLEALGQDAFAIVPMSVVEASGGQPADATYGVMRLDAREWVLVAPAPRDVREAPGPRLEPRLLATPDGLELFWAARQAQVIEYARLDAASGSWSETSTVAARGCVAFAPLRVNGVTSIGVVREAPGGETVELLRLVPDGPAEARWRAGELRWSALPADVTVGSYAALMAYNQQLAALVRCSDGVWRICFAGVGQPPSDETVDLATVFERPQQALRTQGLLQMITFFILLIVLSGLFIFRRNSMINPANFPPGFDAALAFQRLTGWLVDFLPFSLAAAVAVEVSWSDGFRALAAWGVLRSDGADVLPDVKILTWWGLSTVGHALYCLVLEMTFGRTIGKLLFQCRVVAERGVRASAGQIFVRNAMRLIEMMPQFWIFAVLVILSRNRQRIGDVFAQTVVIRPAAPWPRADADDDAAKNKDSSPDDDDRGSDENRPG